MNQEFNETIFYKIDIREEIRNLFTSSYPIIGKIFDQNEEHIYIHKFVSDVKGIIHYGFFERIPRYMLKSVEELKDPEYETGNWDFIQK